MFQGHAFQKFHDDKRLTVLLSDLMNRADVGMVQSGRSTSFTAEAFERLRVMGDIVSSGRKGNEASKLCLRSLVHHAHTTTAQLLDDAVMAQFKADAQILG